MCSASLRLTPDSDQFRSSQIHSFSCRFTQTCPDSLGLVECHLDFLKSQEGKGKSPRDNREKGRSATTHPSAVFTRHSDRAYARTNETKRFPGWFAPPHLRLLLVQKSESVPGPNDGCLLKTVLRWSCFESATGKCQLFPFSGRGRWKFEVPADLLGSSLGKGSRNPR